MLANAAARSNSIDVICSDNGNRVIAFTRTAPNQNLLVAGSMNDTPFVNGYIITTDASRLPAGGWQEVFNSDATVYGGANIGNRGAVLPVTNGQINTVIPAHGFVVLAKVS